MRICFLLLGEGGICFSRLLSQNMPLLCHYFYQFSGKPADLQEMTTISSSGLCFPAGFKAIFWTHLHIWDYKRRHGPAHKWPFHTFTAQSIGDSEEHWFILVLNLAGTRCPVKISRCIRECVTNLTAGFWAHSHLCRTRLSKRGLLQWVSLIHAGTGRLKPQGRHLVLPWWK